MQARALALLERASGQTAHGRAPYSEGRDGPEERLRPAVVTPPAGLVGAGLVPSLPALAGLVVVVLVVAVVLGFRVVAARDAATPVPVAAASASGQSVPSSQATTGAVAAASALPTTPSASATIVVVDVAGAVRRPGVQRLPAGSRVDDALSRAGGVLPDADLTATNRARVLADGELVRVPRVGETPVAAPAPQGGSGVSAGATAPGGTGAPGAPVDLNTADAAALDSLPGIGPALAARILEWRASHGRFTSVDELGEVSGIGDATLERLRPLVRV